MRWGGGGYEISRSPPRLHCCPRSQSGPCLCRPQMVSLLHLADIGEQGVTFQSPTDGRRMLLTPEHSIQVCGWAAVV